MAKRTPQEILQRVIKVARFNGWTVVIIAGLCALVSLASFDFLGLAVGAVVVAGGVIELRGLRRLRRRDNADRAVTLLIRAQLLILALIWIYSLVQLLTLDIQSAANEITQAFAQAGFSSLDLDESGLGPDNLPRLLRLGCYILYGTVSVASLFYQGGLALYYHRRRAAVREALSSTPVAPPPLPPA